MPTFKNRAYLSVTSLVLNDVNVRESNVINRHSRSRYLSEFNIILARLKKIEFENYVCAIYGCKLFLLESTVYLPYFVKIFLFNPDENRFSVY